jgi:hypothetical protein
VTSPLWLIILNGSTYLRANFPLTLNLWVPFIGETIRYTKSPFSMRDLFSFYLHSSSIETEQSLGALQSSKIVSRHPSVPLDQIPNFLQSGSRIVAFYTIIHIVPQTEPSRY